MIIMIGTAAFFLIRYIKEYKTARNEYKELIQQYTNTEATNESDFVDLYALSLINPEIIGWIKIENSMINYPVVKTSDNEYYLSMDFYKNKSKSGCIFMDYRNDGRFTDLSTIIYGHNMKDGSMFNGLHKYKSYTYYREHPVIKIYTFYGIKEYSIIAVYIAEADDIAYDIYFDTTESYHNYKTAIDENKLYETGIELSDNKRTLVLSTCYGKTDRFLVIAQEK